MGRKLVHHEGVNQRLLPAHTQKRREMMVTRIDEEIFGIEFLDVICEWIANNLSPDDVFSEKALNEWAENNGYVPF